MFLCWGIKKISGGNNSVSPLFPSPCSMSVFFKTLPTLIFLFPLGCFSATFTGYWWFTLIAIICHIIWLKVPPPSPVVKVLRCHPLWILPHVSVTAKAPLGPLNSCCNPANIPWEVPQSSGVQLELEPPAGSTLPMLASCWAGVRWKVPVSAQGKQN